MSETIDDLRNIPIAALLPAIHATPIPNASGHYHTTMGKVRVSAGTKGEVFYWFSGPNATHGGKGAINFAISAGLAGDVSDAVRYLRALGPVDSAPIPQVPSSSKPFKPPARTFDPLLNWRGIRTYLVEARKLPADVLKPMTQGPHPALYQGYGDHDGQYLVFPLRDHTDPGKPTVGAIMRYRYLGDPPEGLLKTAKRGRGASHHGWWQVGPYPAPTLIVVEAPIDGLALWSALRAGDRLTTRILATGGTDTPKAPGVWSGVKQMILAQDRDQDGYGDDQAAACIEAAHAAGYSGPTKRLTPPIGTKDWSEVWQVAPDVVRQAVASLCQEEEASPCR